MDNVICIPSDYSVNIINARIGNEALLTFPMRLYRRQTNSETTATEDSCFGGGLILAHGLGSVNPQSKSHLDDEWIDLLERSSSIQQRVRYLSTYTVRGHGNSSGWEETAESDPMQFTWNNLAHDMIAVHEYIEFNLLLHGGPPTVIDSTSMPIPHKNKVIFGGSSMGSATALYACIEQPDIVAALILIRPPTAWKERVARRKHLIASAQRLKERSTDGSKYHLVLSGAMLSDLPLVTESKPSSSSHDTPLQEEYLYDKITCPVLILTIEGASAVSTVYSLPIVMRCTHITGDDAHPVSTALALQSVIANSQLVVSKSKKEAKRSWPDIMSNFLDTVK